MRLRMTLAVLGILAFLPFAFFALGSPRLVLVNEGLKIEYPPARGFFALGAALSVALTASALRGRVLRLFVLVAALGIGLLALGLVTYHLDVSDKSLSSHGPFGTTTIPWNEVTAVEGGGPENQVLVRGKGEAQIKVDTTDFAPPQRAALERSIARHLTTAPLSAPGT